MLVKLGYIKMSNFQQNLSWFLSSYFVPKTRHCITYNMINYLKARKNSLNKIIDDIVLGLQLASVSNILYGAYNKHFIYH